MATAKGSLLKMAAQRGFRVLTTWSMDAPTIRKIGVAFDEACRGETGAARRRGMTVARVVHLADSDARAFAEVEEDWRRALEYNSRFLVRAPAFVQAGDAPGMTFERLIEDGNIVLGSPSTVVDAIRRLFEATGGFGTFLAVCGKDIGTVEQRDRMLHLFAEAVMPKLRDLDSALDEQNSETPRKASAG